MLQNLDTPDVPLIKTLEELLGEQFAYNSLP
jgi:hypothetical protein